MNDKPPIRGDEAIWRWFWRVFVAASVLVIGLSAIIYVHIPFLETGLLGHALVRTLVADELT